MKKKTALYGYFGYGNSGDELIAEKAVEMFKQCVVFTSEKSKHYKTLPRFSLIFLFFKFNYLVFPGGNILQTKSSCLSFYYYAFLILFFRLKNGKVYLINQGVGPVNGFFNNIVLKIVLKSVNFISYRTKNDFNKYYNYNKNSLLGADTVFLKSQNVNQKKSEIKGLKAFIPKMKYLKKDFYIPDNIQILAISPEDYKLIKKRYTKNEVKKIYGLNFEQTVNFLKSYSFIISMPLHGVILSYISGVEKISAYAYDEKVVNFCKEIEDEVNIIDKKNFFETDFDNFNKINKGLKIEELSARAEKSYFLK